MAEADNGNPGLVVMEAFHYQYHPLCKRLVEIVRSGELGNISRVDVAFSAPLWKKGDIRYQLALAGGATMDMGCYPVSLLRLLVPGPRVISAEAKLSSPGVDRAMDAHFSLPDGGSAHIGCSMFSSSVLRLHAEITGDNGKISIFNPFSPQHGHRMKVTTSLGTRKERFSRKASVRLPARGLRGRSRGRRLVPDDGGRRDPYHGAHRRHLHRRRPSSAPAHPGRLMPLAADELTALADAALDAAAGCQAAELRVERIRSQTVRLHDAQPRDDGRRHRLRHGRARRGRWRGRFRRHGRRAAGGGGQPGAPGPGDGQRSPAGREAGASSWRPSPRTVR